MSRKAIDQPSIRARLFVDTELAPARELVLADAQSHYLRSVMRATAGQWIGLFNGRDGEWLGEILDLPRSGVRLRLVEQRRPQMNSPDIWLCFAPLKKSAIDSIAAKATELGVSRLRPVVTAHTAVTRVNTQRLRANAIEAAEQCERLDVPAVDEPAPLQSVLNQWPKDRPLLVCAEAGKAIAISEAAKDLGSVPYGLLIGPEGGFSPEELDRIASLTFVQMVGLGPRILRADTAAIAALAISLGISGNLASRPPNETKCNPRQKMN